MDIHSIIIPKGQIKGYKDITLYICELIKIEECMWWYTIGMVEGGRFEKTKMRALYYQKRYDYPILYKSAKTAKIKVIEHYTCVAFPCYKRDLLRLTK